MAAQAGSTTGAESTPGSTPGSTPRSTPRQDTKEQIREVSLRLFTEQGYDGTSLREIAEELGVTKAALYYHFKSKEEILDSLLATVVEEASALADWAEQQPSGADVREEVLRRAAEVAYGPASRVFAMVQQNQTALRERRQGGDRPGPPVELLRRIIAPLTPPNASYEDEVRARIALVSVFFSAVVAQDIDTAATEEERRDVALRIALGILSPHG